MIGEATHEVTLDGPYDNQQYIRMSTFSARLFLVIRELIILVAVAFIKFTLYRYCYLLFFLVSVYNSAIVVLSSGCYSIAWHLLYSSTLTTVTLGFLFTCGINLP